MNLKITTDVGDGGVVTLTIMVPPDGHLTADDREAVRKLVDAFIARVSA